MTQEDSAYLDRPITVQEIRMALASIASNKSPGVDGVPEEFYRRFWNLLESDLLNVYHNLLNVYHKALSNVDSVRVSGQE